MALASTGPPSREIFPPCLLPRRRLGCGSIAQTEATCRALANRAGCAVISVDYRLAPEYKFPTAAEDSYLATRWVAEHARALGIDPSRIAVGGLSAGGNLAAVVPLMARDRGGPAICFQFLAYPITDYDFDTPSYLENANGFGLSRSDMIRFWNHYLTSPEEALHPYVSPMRADALAGLPGLSLLRSTTRFGTRGRLMRSACGSGSRGDVHPL